MAASDSSSDRRVVCSEDCSGMSWPADHITSVAQLPAIHQYCPACGASVTIEKRG